MGSVHDNKRYFWLKLKEDFFDQDAISWLEEQTNGKAYTLFYLKLCLKALKNNGVLVRRVGDMLIPYDAEKLGQMTNTDKDTVIVALQLLKKIKLVEIQDDGTLYLTQMEDMVGSETNAAARMRNKRKEKEKLLLEQGEEAAANDVRTSSEQSANKVRKIFARDRVRVRDRSRVRSSSNAHTRTCAQAREESQSLQAGEPTNNDNDFQLADAIRFYEDNISTISPFLFEQIQDLEQEYTARWVMEAMKKAVDGGRSKSNIRYIKGILKGWKAEGYAKPWQQFNASEAEKEKREALEAEQARRRRTVGTPEWEAEQAREAEKLKQAVKEMQEEERAMRQSEPKPIELSPKVQALKDKVMKQLRCGV